MTEAKEMVKTLSEKDAKLAYAAIMEGAEIPIADPEAMAQAMAEQLRDAEDFDSVFGEQSLPSWGADLLGVPVLVQDVKLNKSSFDPKQNSGSSVYAVCELTRVDSGEQVRVSCGGKNVLIQLIKMLEKGWTDKPVKLTSNQTGSGYEAYRLVKA